MSVIAVAGVLIGSIAIQGNDLFSQQTAHVTQGLSLNDSVAEVESLIKQSVNIPTQYPTSGQAQFTTNANVLILAIPSINASNQVIENVYDYVVFTKDPTNQNVFRELIFPNEASYRKDQNKVLSTALKDLTFYYLDGNGNNTSPSQASKINFIINLEEKAGTSQRAASASGEVNLNNFSE
jgi:hypothetical protein